MTGDGKGRFPSTMRLKRRRDFQRVYREGAVWRGSCLRLHVFAREDGVRMGIVVPRRVGNAVERNRIKRRLREAFRRVAAGLPAVDIIVLPSADCGRLDTKTVGRLLVRGVERALAKEENE